MPEAEPLPLTPHAEVQVVVLGAVPDLARQHHEERHAEQTTATKAPSATVVRAATSAAPCEPCSETPKYGRNWKVKPRARNVQPVTP
jgi:hypothetical protein